MAIRISGMNSGMDTEAMVQELVKSYSGKTETIKKEQTKAEWKQDAYKSMNTKVKNFHNKYLSNLRFSTAYNKKTTTVSDSSKLSVITGDNAVSGSQTVEVKQLAKAAYLTGGQVTREDGESVTGSTKLSELGITKDTKLTLTKGGEPLEINLSADSTIDQFAKQLSERGLNANFDSSTGRLFISAKESGEASDFDITAVEGDGNSAKALEALGLLEKTTTNEQGEEVVDGTTGAVKVDGQNAKILLNGAEFTSATNGFSINGLTLTAKDVTNEPISIATDTDYDGIYDTIKDFVKEYSSLINELDKLYNADSAKGYEPLTSEEKEALTEEEVEKWETKIKDSLLRRDDTVSSIASIMKEAMSSSYEVDGETLSLSSFGIETLGYFNSAENERNAYHIAGNPDDSDTSGKTDKLKAAIATDPSKVASFFQQLTSNMYDKLQKQTLSSNDRSYGNFYDDKKVKSDYESYETKLADWEEYVAKIEDKYYKQFTRMETAMSKLNSQQSYISSMYGM